MSHSGIESGGYAPLSPNDPVMPEAGDVVLFSGKGWSSDVVRLFTRSRWSHVAVVLRDPDFPRPLLLEANTQSEVADVRSGQRMPGVSLVPLADKLDAYRGQVAFRRWVGDESVTRRRQKLLSVAHDLVHRPYCNFVASWMWRGLRTAPPGMFCSELVAEVYRRAGWLPQHFNPARAVPAHFAGNQLPLQKIVLADLHACGRQGAEKQPEKPVFA